jgi:putative transposase
MTDMIDRAYRTELDPTVEQRRLLARHIAAARVAYNWTLERWRAEYGIYSVASGLRALAGFDHATGLAAWWLGLGLHALVFGEPAERLAKRAKRGAAPRTLWKFQVRLPYAEPESMPNADALHKELTAVKHASAELRWLTEVSAFAVREAAADVGNAYKHFWRRLKKHARGDHSECDARRGAPGCELGEPRFRSGDNRRWHADQPSALRVTERAIKIPGVGWVKLKERGYLPSTEEGSHRFIGGGQCSAVGLREWGGRWYVSLRGTVPRPSPGPRGAGRALRERPVTRTDKRVGVEVGVRHLVVTSGGEVDIVGIREEKRLAAYERKIALWQRRMARRHKAYPKTTPRKDRIQSNGWRRAKAQAALYSRRATELRDYIAGRAARAVVDTGAGTLVMRDAFVADMKARAGKTEAGEQTRKRVSGWVQFARMGDIRRRIEYKQGWAGGTTEFAEKEFASSRRCSVCGNVRDTDPGYPDFHCPACGHTEDREVNSAKNLRDYRSPSGAPVTPAGLAGGNPEGSALRTMPSGTGTTAEEASASTPPDRPRNRTRHKRGTGNGAITGAANQPDGPSGPNAIDHPSPFERSSDARADDEQLPRVTAECRADDLHRSQTAPQSLGVTRLRGDGSEGLR